MRLIVGLGNPEAKQQNNRHNIGFKIVDRLQSGVNGSHWEENKKFKALICRLTTQVLLLKPQTYMNSSGKAVSKIVNHYKIKLADIWVIHDDLDIPLEEFKIQLGIGPKIHNGLLSIEEKLGVKNFWRVRIGVDNRSSDNRVPGEKYVLQNFTNSELTLVDQVVEKVINELRHRINI